MKVKKIPMRTCIITQEKYPKKELIRVVRTPNKQIIVDITGKANGRGAYICDNIECFEKMIKSKKLEKSFERKISDDIYEALRNEFVNKI